jgi:hypothetical protein
MQHLAELFLVQLGRLLVVKLAAMWAESSVSRLVERTAVEWVSVKVDSTASVTVVK